MDSIGRIPSAGDYGWKMPSMGIKGYLKNSSINKVYTSKMIGIDEKGEMYNIAYEVTEEGKIRFYKKYDYVCPKCKNLASVYMEYGYDEYFSTLDSSKECYRCTVGEEYEKIIPVSERNPMKKIKHYTSNNNIRFLEMCIESEYQMSPNWRIVNAELLKKEDGTLKFGVLITEQEPEITKRFMEHEKETKFFNNIIIVSPDDCHIVYE